ncbi:MAG: signal peptidase I [Clostridiales Family XIII bacterium]|jgi:signal peptidase I|nr:signal peptidase I [Clostridiales Family XIII bacterium]
MPYVPPNIGELLADVESAETAEFSQPAPPAQEAPKRNFQRAANVLVVGICVFLVAGSLVLTLSKNPDKSYFGYRFYHVLTTSMEPQAGGPAGGFRAGDIIVVKRMAPEEIRPGDIITFTPGDDPRVSLTHRVVRTLDEYDGQRGLWFVTKGDANNAEDIPTPAERVVGRKVLAIPKAGLVLQTIKSNIVPFAVLGASIFGFLAALSYFFAKPKRAREAAVAAAGQETAGQETQTDNDRDWKGWL